MKRSFSAANDGSQWDATFSGKFSRLGSICKYIFKNAEPNLAQPSLIRQRILC